MQLRQTRGNDLLVAYLACHFEFAADRAKPIGRTFDANLTPHHRHNLLAVTRPSGPLSVIL